LDTNSLLFWFSYQVSYNLRNRQSIETWRKVRMQPRLWMDLGSSNLAAN
jgi:hypothetical protein